MGIEGELYKPKTLRWLHVRRLFLCKPGDLSLIPRARKMDEENKCHRDQMINGMASSAEWKEQREEEAAAEPE